MVQRDRTCQAPYCVTIARGTCPGCFSWLCPKHLADHQCRKLEAWQEDSPTLNAFNPRELKGLTESGPSPTRKDWRKIVDR